MNDIGFYLKLLVRRLPAMAALILLCSCISAVVALRLPTTYETRATLLLEEAQITEDTVRGGAQSSAGEQLDVIQQRLLTRANLLKIARDNRVFPDQASMSPDEIVTAMRARTTVRRTGGRRSATLLNIGFRGERPRVVAAVVNQYVNIVLEESSDFRSQRAEGALRFFEQEVETASTNLDMQNTRIVEFKAENADALPENLNLRQNRLSLLQERLKQAGRDLQALDVQRDNIQRVYDVTGSLVGSSANTGITLTPEQKRLQTLEGELRVALGVYSEQNPRVRLLRNQIETLKQQVNSSAQEQSGEVEALEGTLSPLDIALKELDGRRAVLVQEVAAITKEVEELEESILLTANNGITLDAMVREQQNLQGLYSAAVQRLSQARMRERIELSARGERITVLEPASVPTSPASPNRPLILAMGVGTGLGLAAALFVVLELLSTAIRRPADIVQALNIAPLATVPRFETVADRRWRRMAQLALLAVVAVAVPTSLWLVDTYYMPVDQLFEKAWNRFF